MADPKREARALLLELVAREGEAVEAWGRAIKAYGEGAAPPEILARDWADLTLRVTADAAHLWLRAGAVFTHWGLSLAGIRVESAREQAASPAGKKR